MMAFTKKDDIDLLLSDSINCYIDNYFDAFDTKDYPDLPHEFSDKYNSKIKKLIKKQKRFYFPVFRTGFRKAVAVTVTVTVLMFSAVMSVEALRKPFLRFITRPFSTHTDVEIVAGSGAPDEILKIFEAGYIPDGFTLAESFDAKEFCCTRVYSDGTENIEFTQWVRSEYTPSVNTEGYEMEKLDINGCEGFGISMDRIGHYLLSWDNGEYIFQITGKLDKDEALKMANSVKEVNTNLR